jgi:hypothetical protein
MPVDGTLAPTSKGARGLRWRASLAVLALSMAAPAATATSEIDGAILSPGAETSLRSAPSEGALAPETGKILREIGKQAIDQPAHVLIAAAPIWLSRHLVGVPWYGWAAAPLLAYREWRQWPSSRWWDPPLDWAFLTIGAVLATWSRGEAPVLRLVRRALLQCSNRIRIPAMTSRMPVTSVRLGRSWNRKIDAAKVNTSSI